MATEAKGGHYRIEKGKRVLVSRTEETPADSAQAKAPKAKTKTKPKE